MKPNHKLATLALLVTALAILIAGAAAQTPGQAGSTGSTDRRGAAKDTSAAAAQPETTLGAYQIKGAFEFGYRFVDETVVAGPGFGNSSRFMYNTLVNLEDGPRLLETTLNMRARPGTGVLFDNFWVSAFGFGGDPETAGRIQLDKDKWYWFSGSFRRFKNFFDYDLLANPLNPPQSGIVVPYSPHRYENVRRMIDGTLTLAPQAPVSLRLGYNRVRVEGPSWTTFHEGTDPLLFQPLDHRNDAYQIGIDFKVLPKTVFAYDQFLQWYRSDTSWVLDQFPVLAFNPATGTTTPVNIGLPFDPFGQTGGPFPCRNVFSQPGGTVPANCNYYIGYTRQNPIRVFTPTEQFSFQSNYLKNFDLNGRILYSDSDLDSQMTDNFRGLVSRLAWGQFRSGGPAEGTRVNVTGDFGITYHITDRLRISDQFRFYRFATHNRFNFFEEAWQIGTPGCATPAACNGLNPIGGPPTLVENLVFDWDISENVKSNQVELEFDFTRAFGAHVGYRFRNREIRSGLEEFEEADSEEIDELDNLAKNQNFNIDEHTGLVGFWIRPSDAWRFSVDAEITTADDWTTRVTPRQQQYVRARLNFTPRQRFALGLYGDVWQGRNGQNDVQLRAHQRNFGINTNIIAAEGWAFDLAYNYNDLSQNNLICYAGTFQPFGTTACAQQLLIPGTIQYAPNRTLGGYDNNNHYGSFTLLMRPIRRVNLSLGYSIVTTNGDTVLLNLLQSYGTLKSIYHRPLAGIEIGVTERLAFRGAWNYYGYNERSQVGPTTPRDFHANTETVSLRYTF